MVAITFTTPPVRDTVYNNWFCFEHKPQFIKLPKDYYGDNDNTQQEKFSEPILWAHKYVECVGYFQC